MAIKPFRVSIVQCRGSAYEVGLAQARLFAATAKGRAFLRRKAVRLPWWFNLRTEERVFAKYAPALWEEIGGLAQGTRCLDGAGGAELRQQRLARRRSGVARR